MGLGDVSDDKDDDEQVTIVDGAATVGVGVETLIGEKRTVGSPKGGNLGEPDLCF